jgi:hypothetical protein
VAAVAHLALVLLPMEILVDLVAAALEEELEALVLLVKDLLAVEALVLEIMALAAAVVHLL